MVDVCIHTIQMPSSFNIWHFGPTILFSYRESLSILSSILTTQPHPLGRLDFYTLGCTFVTAALDTGGSGKAVILLLHGCDGLSTDIWSLRRPNEEYYHQSISI